MVVEDIKKGIKGVADMFSFKKKLPRHVALTLNGNIIWARKHDIPLNLMYHKKHEIIKKVISLQVKYNIPLFTFLLTRKKKEETEDFTYLVDSLVKFFDNLSIDETINKNQIKVSILGKWYDLPGRLIDSIKKVINTTKEYDKFYVNFCVNYEGQEEIIDGCKLIARKIKADKLDIELIDKEMIKDSLYSSYFLPPDLIIVTGKRKKTHGILLWDSSDSIIFHTKKNWPEFTKSDFVDALKEYQD